MPTANSFDPARNLLDSDPLAGAFLRQQTTVLEEPPIDWDSLVQRCMGQADFAGKILKMFSQRVAERLEAIEQALLDEDSQRLAREAHVLAGAAGNISAEPLKQLSVALERTAEQGDLAQAKRLFENLQDESARAVRYIAGTADSAGA